MNDLGTADRQWAVLEALATASRGLRFWLSGGWALDFHCGRVTRRHSDIDVIVHEDDRGRFWEALRASGMCRGSVRSSGVVDTVRCGGVEVEVTYVYAQGDMIVTRGVEHWPWPEGSLDDPPRRFQELEIGVVSVAGLLEMKTRYEEFFDVPMRVQDDLDAQLLMDLGEPDRRDP